MRGTDARVVLLRNKVDHLVGLLIQNNQDEVVDSMDHYLLGTLRQPNLDRLVFDKVTYYVNNVISDFCPNFKW